MTGKGDRWGRNKVGRSEPAFLSASTIALPPSTCTARREAGQLCRRLLFFCEAGQLLAVCCFEACAGRRVRRLCPCSTGCVPARLCHAMPTALISSCPRSVHFALPPVHSMCARIVASLLQELSCWQLQHGPAVAACAPVHF